MAISLSENMEEYNENKDLIYLLLFFNLNNYIFDNFEQFNSNIVFEKILNSKLDKNKNSIKLSMLYFLIILCNINLT